MRPTIRQLEYALAVAEHGHFRRAAAACHVTQPALSNQIRQLEKILGLDLFERDRRSVRITAAGERVLARARACLRELDELERTADRLSGPGAGLLRIGVIPTVAPYLMPRLLPAFRDTHPGYELELWELQTRPLVAKLDDGALDLLLLALPVPSGGPRGRELAREPFVLVLPESHPLATAPRVNQSDIAGEEVLLLEEGHCLREHALDACGIDRRRLPGRMHANSLSMLVQMVRNGLGITLLPASAVATELSDPAGLVVRRFAEPEPSRMLGAIWRDDGPRTAEIEALAEFCGGQLREILRGALASPLLQEVRR